MRTTFLEIGPALSVSVAAIAVVKRGYNVTLWGRYRFKMHPLKRLVFATEGSDYEM